MRLDVEFVDCYGINVYIPTDWKVFYSESNPIGYLASPDEDALIFFSPLNNKLVEQGLRAIVTTILEATLNRKFSDARVLYNRENNLTRYFGLSLENEKFFVVGILDLNMFSGALGRYNEYFVRFSFSKKYDRAESYLWLLKKIRKVEPGIPIDPPYTEYVWGDSGGTLWSVYVPPTTIISPREDGFFGIVGSMYIETRIESVLRENKSYIRYVVEDIVRRVLGDDYEFYVEEEKDGWLYFKAYKDPMWGDIRVLLAETHINYDYLLARIYAFFYPKLARSVAERIMARIIATWHLHDRLIKRKVPPPSPLTLTPTAPTIQTYPPKILEKLHNTIPPKTNQPSKTELEKCREKKRRLKVEIENVKMEMRLLENDYKNYMTVYSATKRGELTTGYYTYRNPAGKIRFIHTKTRSPVLGDRFWEHKDVKHLENKVFVVTRNFAPPLHHMFSELKWDVQEKIEELERKYKQKIKALEKELRKLEEQLKQLKC